MQLIWNKTFIPDEDYIRSPLYETSLHHYNDNGLSINIDIHMTIAIDKKKNCYLLFIWDTTPGIRTIDKTTFIPDIPIYKYDLSSILIFAHDFLDKFIIDRYKDYYHVDNLSDTECIVNLKYNPHKCGNCKYLINKDYRYNSGTCQINRIFRRFTDICIHEEEML